MEADCEGVGVRYYVDDQGNYLGGTDGNPLSLNEVPTAPNDAREKWDGVKWVISEDMRVKSITDKANAHVLTKYSELKQRKLLSIQAKLNKKEVKGGVLDASELALEVLCEEVEVWISSVRDVENAAIADGVTLADDVVFPI